MAEERIQKIMAEQGLCSRRAAEQIIAEGRVKVNGHPVKVGDKMDPNRDVLHVDDEGHLTKVGTARGRNASLKALVDHMAETAIDPAGQTVFISHGDCEEDANKVAEDVKRRFGVQTVVLNNVGPVIGAHSGPGTVALFFLGRHR